MSKSYLLLFLFVIGWNVFLAQSFDRKVFATAGRDASNGLTGTSGRRMTYTIGEPIIYRGSNTAYSFSNGFIQPIGISPVAPPSPTGMVLAPGDIAVYPNPFGTYIMLNGQEESQEEVSLQLIDLQGKLILQQAIVPHNYKLEIPQDCSPGTYLLNMYTTSGQFIQQNRLIKMIVETNN
jgi:hypothetical protein